MGGVFRYIVKGIRTHIDGEVHLEVECQTCSHGWKCMLLVAQDDYGKIVHVHMLNEDEDNPQRHWHSNDGLSFWPTSELAKLDQLKRMKREAEEAVSRAKDELRRAEQKLKQWVGLIDEVK
jgi:hypothetical protein